MGWLAGKDAGILAGWLGYEDDPSVFQGYGPDGVATLVPSLQDGFTVTLSWVTDVIPHRDGTEQRAATLLRPKQTYKGAAVMNMNETRLQRARLARYATQGAVFLLALPHEQALLTRDASGTTLFIGSDDLGLADWKQIGQRVVVLSSDRSQSINGVIQDYTNTTIVLDVAPGTIGKAGGWVMPLMAVYLDPQQDFSRYRVSAETWNISARAAIYDFAPPHSQFDVGTITGNVGLSGALIVARKGGFIGDTLVSFTSNTVASLSESGPITTVFIHNGVTTLGDVQALLLGSSNVIMRGAFNALATLSGSDQFSEFMPEPDGQGAMGPTGVVSYDGHPVWYSGLQNDSTISDPSQALTEIVDLGGVPISLGHASDPVWGRTVAITSDTWADWWLLKGFLAIVRGRQRMFWLSTDRNDFTWVSSGANSITVRTDDNSDIDAWWPLQRDRLQLAYADGTIDYVQITARVDNGDGTQTLTTIDTILGVDIAMISWLEAVRFDSDDFTITFDSSGFSMSTTARAHTPSTAELGEED